MSATVNQDLYVSQNDMARLRTLIQRFRGLADRDTSYLDALEARLDNAQPVRPRDVPSDVVTMNTRVCLRDPETGLQLTYTVVFPEDADPAQDKISVLAPLGAALFGAHVGDRINWSTPNGERQMVVESILYQPEAMGHYDL